MSRITEDELNRRFCTTTDALDEAARPFEEGSWKDAAGSDLHFSGKVMRGRPRLFDEDLCLAAFRLPRSYNTAVDQASARLGISRSEFLRNAVYHELAAVGGLPPVRNSNQNA